jgi:hypothetical protein
MTPLAVLAALLFQSAPAGFQFEQVHAWKWNEGRQENIPALSAVIANRTGKDYAEARFRVHVDCSAGGERSYELKLRDVLLGLREVNVTAYDAIGKVAFCEGPARVEFLGGTEYAPDRRPSYIVFGFSLEQGGGVSTVLEGILDHRRSESSTTTRRIYWQDGGQKLESLSNPDTAYYSFRVDPGDIGIAGFLLDRNPNSTGPVDRFLRFFHVEPGQVAFPGVFRISLNGQFRSVVIDPSPDLIPAVAKTTPRTVAPAPATKSKIQGILTLDM